MREGVSDLAENFNNRIEDLRRRFIAEVAMNSLRPRIDDHETLHDAFEHVKSKLNDRLVSSNSVTGRSPLTKIELNRYVWNFIVL